MASFQVIVGFIVWIVCEIELCKSSERLKTNIRTAFHDQLLNAKINLTKSLMQITRNKRETSPLNVNWNHLWTESIQNSNSAVMQNINNKIFILSKDTVYNLNGSTKPFELIPIISLQDISSQVSFIESIEWEKILFLLLGLKNGECWLMTATNKLDFTIRQTIANLDNPVDAEFFILKNQLFVIIINEMDDSKFSTRIYRWRNTHLDEEPSNNIKTIKAKSVTTFTYKESVMLVIGQTTTDKQQVSSQVLKMKSNGLIEKIQFLPTQDPVSIKHFTLENENFIFVLEKNVPSTIYWWEGKEFIEWLRLPLIFGDFILSVGYARGNTLILLTKQNIITVYTMDWQKLHKLFMFGFSGDVVNAALYDDEKLHLVIVIRENRPVRMKIEMVEIRINSKDTKIETYQKEPAHNSNLITECVKQLEAATSTVADKLTLMKKKLSNVLYSNKPALIYGNIKVLGPNSGVNVETGRIEDVYLQSSEITLKSQLVNEKIVDMSSRTKNLATYLQDQKYTSKNKELIFENNVQIKEAKMNSIKTKKINDALFNPEDFISLSDDQRLRANILSKNVYVEWLLADYINDKSTINLVPQNNRIDALLKVSNLFCNNIDLAPPIINGINISNVVTNKKDVEFKGETILQNLIVENLKAGVINKEQNVTILLDIAKSKSNEELSLLDNTTVYNLNVDRINGIDIENLINNLVLKGKNNTISGDLYFASGFQTKKLVTKKFNKLLPSNMPYSANENADYPDKEIKRRKRQPTASDSFNTKRKLIVYKGKVKIEGNLQVRKLHFSNAELYVKNYSTPILMDKINQTFWTKHSDQTINVPINFVNGAALEGNLDVKSINGYELSAYNNTNTIFSHLKLQNVSIYKFVTTGNLNDFSTVDFKKLNKSIVRREGVHSINGKKVFLNNLQINHLQTHLLNEKSPFQAFINKGATKWENLVVSNLSVKGDIDTDLLNKINLKKKFQEIILTHESYNLTSLQFTKVTGNSIDVQTLNGVELKKVQNLINLTRENRHQVHFNGSLKVPAILSTQSINRKILTKLLPMVVNGSNPSVIRGKKSFKSQVVVENGVSVTVLNSEILQDVYKSRLSKSRQQTITGFYTMPNCKIGSLYTEFIDGVRFNDLVFINDEIITIKSDIHVQSLTMLSSSTVASLMDGCMLPKVEDSLIFTNEINWSSLHVTDNVQWKLNSTKGIQKLFDNAMVKGKAQIISGNVRFKSLVKSENFEAGFINNLNIPFILEDAVFKNKFNQVVFGRKEFMQKIFCSHGKIFKDAAIPVVNKINITDLNSKIIMQDTDNIIRGHKIFRNGFKAFKFTCQGGVNSVKSNYIVTENTDTVLPEVIFKSLEITEDLTIGVINNINLTDLMKNVVMLKSEERQTVMGQVIFKNNVQLTGNSTIKSINSLNIEDTLLTYDFQKYPQNIYNCKNLTTPIALWGHFDVDIINGKNLSRMYKTAILEDGNYTIHGSIVFDKEQHLSVIYGKQYFSKDKQLSHLNQSFENNGEKRSNDLA